MCLIIFETSCNIIIKFFTYSPILSDSCAYLIFMILCYFHTRYYISVADLGCGWSGDK